MKLHADRFDQPTISALGPGWLAVDGRAWHESVLLGVQGGPQAWHCTRFESLTQEDFRRLAECVTPAGPPELIILGSGQRLRFAHPALLQAFISRRIGVETMDTPAACRTYNILVGEGRRVIGAFLIEP